MKILTINGIRTDGSTNTDRLNNALSARGYKTQDVNYPRVNIFTARSRDRQFDNAAILCEAADDGDVLIAHSYGCMLALRSMELGAKYSKVFLFAPAMNVDFIFPYLGAEEIYVIHNKTDQAIKLGNMLMFGHDFGNMGRVGYQGAPDPRVTNVEDFDGEKGERNHSHYFTSENLSKWADFVEGKL